jgi:acetyl esterase/lipase
MSLQRITDTTIPGPHGPVPIRIYGPAGAGTVGLVWIHGGAFRTGDLDVPEADWVSRRLAGAGITVVSVDYRLAVDGVHFPVPSDDVLAAWTWATTTASTPGRLGVPAARWHIGGGSAGGNLAASVTLQARDRRATLPLSSVLIYPVLHSELPASSPGLAARLTHLPTEQRFPADLTRELNVNYVGKESLLTHPYAFPAHADLTGLPPTLIVNADLDDLRPSGEAYAAALALAGVDVTVVHEPGVTHGHLNEPGSAGARRTVQRIRDWLLDPTHDAEADAPRSSRRCLE